MPDSHSKGETGDIKEKRQLHLEDYGSLEFVIDPESADIDSRRNSNQTYIVTNVTSTELNIIDKDENITSIEINDMTIPEKSVNLLMETTTSLTNISTVEIRDMIKEYLGNKTLNSLNPNMNTIVHEETTIKQDSSAENHNGDCNKYQKTSEFDINMLADVWKITFYTIPTTLKCFKLHIKSITVEDQKIFENKYGNFHNKVKWNDVILEITSSNRQRLGTQRRHFLQKNDLQHGVLDNIIISQEQNGTTTAVLHEENPDQWLVFQNLLLMRDCNTGDVVVFSKVPSEPQMSDIEGALIEFGETGPINGTRACEGYVKAWVKVA